MHHSPSDLPGSEKYLQNKSAEKVLKKWLASTTTWLFSVPKSPSYCPKLDEELVTTVLIPVSIIANAMRCHPDAKAVSQGRSQAFLPAATAKNQCCYQVIQRKLTFSLSEAADRSSGHQVKREPQALQIAIYHNKMTGSLKNNLPFSTIPGIYALQL
ncbi:hypothetical protein M419DRAFT_33592 [Trichoderma reesei RUT C-30]|uniref:Uncharacterized protein n=1 Tax=Hypocrea jecorina (strain ATCC 56765 / BCRC 32924 / NRRL 11460 / Rut C-30) TaxID=1344414 RepID=A0A024SGW4_HYPJR|nr:hypothetical protein M419DRAFT_33592 [Trichoderma reesei RUT C-30]